MKLAEFGQPSFGKDLNLFPTDCMIPRIVVLYLKRKQDSNKPNITITGKKMHMVLLMHELAVALMLT